MGQSMNNNLLSVSIILSVILGAVKLTEIKKQPKIVVEAWYAYTKFAKFMNGYLNEQSYNFTASLENVYTSTKTSI